MVPEARGALFGGPCAEHEGGDEIVDGVLYAALDDELRRAKAKMIGQKKIARQDLGGLATTMGLDELFGLGYDASDHDDKKYESVTIEQIRDVATKYFQPATCVVAISHPSA